MRHFATILAILALAAPLAACCGDLPTARVALPALDVPPPLSFKQEPKFQPSGYVQVIPQQIAPSYAPVQQYAAPQYAAPCAPAAPAYTPGYQYAAPPIPQPGAAPCR